jgi:hypothetical protein
MGASGLQLVQAIENGLQHPFKIDEWIVRREPHHVESLCTQERVASCVVALLLLVLRPVEFDDQQGIEAREIRDVISDGMLSLRSESVIAARRTRAFCCALEVDWFCIGRAPIPAFPQRGREEEECRVSSAPASPCSASP